jgi:tetratricopeptide (TPR) repeat protein
MAVVASASHAQTADPLAALDRTVALAEQRLRIDERQIAESRYRTALLQGWMILGALYASDGQLAEARRAFTLASTSAVENRAALHSLAVVQIQLGETAPALEILTRMASESPRDAGIRRTLAQALIAAGKPEEAVQELEEARALAPADLELAFALASGYLRLKKPDSADPLFTQIAAARPVPQTYVLIGRTYRDSDYYDRARTALRRALKMDPLTRRAHYYLGTTALMEEGVVRLDEAIDEFKHELKLTPDDPPTTLRLGMALVEARRYEEALPFVQSATKGQPRSPEAWLYLGRAQLGAGRASDAVPTLKRALEIATPNAPTSDANDQARLRSIHYQLATALRQIGSVAEADREFAEAQQLSARRAESERERLSQYMADAGDTSPAASPALPALPLEGGFETLSASDRRALQERVRTTLARAYLNMGVMHAQGDRFTRAAELFESCASVNPAFPQVQYSLGVAYFNAQQFDKAAAALDRALQQEPQNVDARRMLALALLNAENYSKAAELLRNDPRLPSDPALQYAYGLALVRSDRAQEAEQIFSRVLAQHPDVPELNVVLGHAHAAQGDYDAAIASLRRAIALKKDVAEANSTLGVIYLKQGNLAAAAEALRAELASHPNDIKARHTLATVLDLDGHSDEAVKELRAIVAIKPTYADARYLFGKILLARGSAADAVDHLEAAARLAPEDANIHYQLGQAYQRLGRAESAAQEFEIYKRLKSKQGGAR